MSYTGLKLFNSSMAVMNQISETGVISDEDVQEYKNRAPYFLDMWQKENAKNGDLFKTFEKSCIRKNNLLGDTNHYGIIVENNGESQSYSANGANCFFLEVDGDCVITLTENGVPISGKYIFNDGIETIFDGTITITVPEGTTSFLPIRGIVTNPDCNVTITLTGDYYFRHNNRALAPYKYKYASKVPDFKPWYKILMPEDFKSRTQVINEFPSWQYEQANDHKWEGKNELYIHFAYEGIVRIKYIPIPTEITVNNWETYEIEIDDITAQLAIYFMAEHYFRAYENTDYANRCVQKYAELKRESMIKQPLTVTEIIDVYGI